MLQPDSVRRPALASLKSRLRRRRSSVLTARAGTDPAYKARLLSDATAAIVELGFSGVQGEDMVVVENTPTVYNMGVCNCAAEQALVPGSELRVVDTIRGHFGLFGIEPEYHEQADSILKELLST